MRGRYHAAAGYTSQFINAPFAKASKIWQSWGATEEDAMGALLPLARGTLASIESAGVADGMPGPVSRGDIGSIEEHGAAPSPLGPDVIEFYRVVCDRTTPLGMRRGPIDAQAAMRAFSCDSGFGGVRAVHATARTESIAVPSRYSRTATMRPPRGTGCARDAPRAAISFSCSIGTTGTSAPTSASRSPFSSSLKKERIKKHSLPALGNMRLPRVHQIPGNPMRPFPASRMLVKQTFAILGQAQLVSSRPISRELLRFT